MVHFHVAQVDPVTSTISGATLEPVDHGVTAPHICWTAEWDSIEQAEQTYAGMFADAEALATIPKAGGGNPFWTEDKPLFAYAKLECNWMTVRCSL
jgi:hypothetical protein